MTRTLLVAASAALALAADWPQYRGPNHDGKTSGAKVFTNPNLLNQLNSGITVTCAGSIVVLSRTANRMFEPRVRNRANAYAASEQESNVPAMFSTASRDELAK